MYFLLLTKLIEETLNMTLNISPSAQKFIDQLSEIEKKLHTLRITRLLKCFEENNNTPMTYEQISQQLFNNKINDKVISRGTIAPYIITWNKIIEKYNILMEPCSDVSCLNFNKRHRVCCKKDPNYKYRTMVFWISNFKIESKRKRIEDEVSEVLVDWLTRDVLEDIKRQKQTSDLNDWLFEECVY